MWKEFTIEDNLRGFQVEFKTTWGLFAYQKIDTGTRLLIENLEIKKGDRCLDLGCGYGAIGVTMAKLNPKGRVWMVNRDMVALEYAMTNCTLNGVTNAQVVGSNGLTALNGEKFDVIAANLPTHMGNEMLEWLIGDMLVARTGEGRIWLVMEKRMTNFLKKILGKIQLVEVVKKGSHVVWKI